MTKQEFLRAHGADQLGHTHDTLLDHLSGTAAMLAEWGAATELCDAGLFHSVYGTESYPHTVLGLELRSEVRELIGAYSERLVFLFGTQEKASLYENLFREGPSWLVNRMTGDREPIDDGEFRDLCELTVANWLEQRPRVPEHMKMLREQAFRAMRPFLSDPAWAALSGAYGFEVG